MSQSHQENPRACLGSPSSELSSQDHHHTCAHILQELNMQA